MLRLLLSHPPHLPLNDSTDHKGFWAFYENSYSSIRLFKFTLFSGPLAAVYQQYPREGGGLLVWRPGPVAKQLARCFPSHLERAAFRVKFRGSGRAACNRSPGHGPQIEHRAVKIAYHFGLLGTRFPPLCRLGKEGGVPASQRTLDPQRELELNSRPFAYLAKPVTFKP